MAMATELLKECKICSSTFVNPKLLPCHHTFCDACVTEMMKESTLVCPTCQRKCHATEILSGFMSDEFLQQMVEQEENPDKGKTESLEWARSKQWEHHLSVSVPSVPFCLRLIHGDLWQCHYSGITVYDAALQRLRTMDSDNMGPVYDVASLPCGEVVVAADNGLYRMTASGERHDRIANGFFRGAVQHRGRVYAVNCDTCTVHVYQNSDGLTQCCSFPVSAPKGGPITLSVSKDLLYTCVFRDHRLYVVTLSGEFQYSNDSEGSCDAGRLDCPLICATDDAGAALIADSCIHRLQVVDTRCQWSTVSLQPAVETPFSAVLFGGKLYISSHKKKRLHMYK